jgi:hypothetical protein
MFGCAQTWAAGGVSLPGASLRRWSRCQSPGISQAGTTIPLNVQGFDADNHAVVGVKVTTRCALSGRGAKSRNYLSCGIATFDLVGARLSQTAICCANWLQGTAGYVCPFVPAPAVIELDDDFGNVLAWLQAGPVLVLL